MWQTAGHPAATGALQRGLEDGRVAHAYLITGPRHVGKMTLAMDLARLLNCQGPERPCGECAQCGRVTNGVHADVRILGLETAGESDARARVAIGINQVRELRREANLKPYEGAYRVFIVDGAERLSEEASNSLLKVLEEPPDQVVILILASEPELVLPTIRSRCQRVELRPVPPEVIEAMLADRFDLAGDRAQEIARVSGGRPGWAIRAAESPELLERRDRTMDSIEGTLSGDLERRFAYAANLAAAFGRARDPVNEELRVWAEWWRDVLVIKEGVPELVANLSHREALSRASESVNASQIARVLAALKETQDLLERNVNPRLTLEQLMLTLPRISGVATAAR